MEWRSAIKGVIILFVVLGLWFIVVVNLLVVVGILNYGMVDIVGHTLVIVIFGGIASFLTIVDIAYWGDVFGREWNLLDKIPYQSDSSFFERDRLDDPMYQRMHEQWLEDRERERERRRG